MSKLRDQLLKRSASELRAHNTCLGKKVRDEIWRGFHVCMGKQIDR